ncbi:MAG: chalcone isomerase [Halomonadaceae bacterium]|nr:MAG: chalcone isomerase [Halomonadaceae bacterium]
MIAIIAGDNPMKTLMITCLTMVLVAGMGSLQADTTDIRGVDVPKALKVGDDTLVLNGGERRRRWFMDIMVVSLYLPEPSSDAEAILASEDPMAITLHITTDRITQERMSDSITEGFERSTGGDTSAITGEKEALLAAFGEELSDGDLIELIYTSESRVKVRHNGEVQGEVESSMAFKEALFGIWLGEEPPEEDMKQRMLGE